MSAWPRWDEAYVGEHDEEDPVWDDGDAHAPEAPVEVDEDVERAEASYRAWDEEQRAKARERRAAALQPADNGTRGNDADLFEVMVWRLRDNPPRRAVTIEVSRGLVEREDGTVMRVGEQPKYGGRMRGEGAGWKKLGGPTHAALARAKPSQNDLLAIFGHMFQGRQEEALRVAKIKPKGDQERALKADVIAFANAFRAHGAKGPLASFFGVSVRTIGTWRKVSETLPESDDG